MAVVVLASGDECLVDDADMPLVGRWKWKRHPQGYAARTGYVGGKFVTILMHRLLTDCPAGLEVDHINRNKLDNRRANLRCVTHSENEYNKGATSRNTTSGIRGVCFDRTRGRWKATAGKRSLGRFDTMEEAIAAREAVVPAVAYVVGRAVMGAEESLR